MPNKPFFSVVIPLYNKAPHVARSVGSVLNQTFRDFELLIVNDASTDGSADEVQKFNDPRICLLHREKPGPGGYAARNLGIREAKGQWIAFLDADDEWYPDHLGKMHELFFQYPDVYFMGCGWHTCINGKKTEDRYFKRYQSKGLHVLSPKDYLQSCLSQMQPVWTSITCVKKSSPVIPNLFPADTEVKRGGDQHAWLKLICYHKKMVWSNYIGAIYHIDSVNMVTKIASTNFALLNENICNELSKKLDHKEIVLLRKWLNTKIKEYWLLSIVKDGCSPINLRSKLLWKGDLLNALMLAILSFIPKSIIKYLYAFKQMLKQGRD